MKGFEERKFSLSSIKFIGEYRNEYVTLDNKGLLPSISRMLSVGKKESEIKDDKSNFKYFWKFMADSETFLIPHDHEDFDSGVIDRQLLYDLIHGN